MFLNGKIISDTNLLIDLIHVMTNKSISRDKFSYETLVGPPSNLCMKNNFQIEINL